MANQYPRIRTIGIKSLDVEERIAALRKRINDVANGNASLYGRMLKLNRSSISKMLAGESRVTGYALGLSERGKK
jgi:hypothetical protein